jgi:hypothetical protein
MAKPDVSGTSVSGATNITGGAERINGPVAASKDDIADINAAQQDAKTIPSGHGTKTSIGRLLGKGEGGY